MGPKEKKNSNDFIWTNEESELLLSVVNDFKVAKAYEGVDWESVKTKYSDIFHLYVAALPDDASGVTKGFPHKKESISK